MQFQPNVTREHLLTIMVWCTLLLSVQAAIAKNDAARVQGTVTDMEGTAIGAAAITVKNLDTGALFKTRSDGTGEFTVSTLPAGNYKAGVQVVGFQSQVQKFSLASSEVRTIHFRLAVSSRQGLQLTIIKSVVHDRIARMGGTSRRATITSSSVVCRKSS